MPKFISQIVFASFLLGQAVACHAQNDQTSKGKKSEIETTSITKLQENKAKEKAKNKEKSKEPKEEDYNEESLNVSAMIEKLRARSKSFRWDRSIFVTEGWHQKGETVNKLPLIYWTCGNEKSENRSLIISGVHGDEVTPIYWGFRVVDWLKANPKVCENKFIVVAPIVNPDGFLRYARGTRTNYNKVDINRNFNTPDWEKDAHRLWKTKLASQRRYYPGDQPESEPETLFQKWMIEHFKPKKIMSVHSPLNMLDFDSPGKEDMRSFSQAYVDSCDTLKQEMKRSTTILQFHAFGTFPGSLGNYAGKVLGIPTITPELPSANPSEAAWYFGEMEASLRMFLDYKMVPKPDNAKVANTNN